MWATRRGAGGGRWTPPGRSRHGPSGAHRGWERTNMAQQSGAAASSGGAIAAAELSRRRRRPPIDLRHLWHILLFVGPSCALIGFLIVYPAIKTIYTSFTTTAGIGYNAPQQWTGFSNYNDLFTDPTFQTTLINNVLWLVVITPVTVILGVIFAVLFDKVRYEVIPKSIVFIPMAISATAGGVIWRLMYADDPHTGTVNAILGWFHIGPISFLGDTNFVNWALFGAQIWISLGFAVVVLSASLKA